MRHIALALFVCLISIPSVSQESAQYRACTLTAHTQAELNTCASKEALRADTQLDGVLKQLLSRAKGDSNAIEKIKAAEKAWLTYRDAYIDAMYPAIDKQAEYGSMYPAQVDILRAKLTEEQTAAVRELLRQYGEPE